MGKILPFPAKKPSKFGFERVRKYTGGNQCQPGMSHTDLGKVLRLPTNISPFEEALLLDECGDSRAEKAYRRAISEGDLAADAYCNLGIIESKAGRITKAFDCFTKSLEHNPRHFESHYNLGNLYFNLGLVLALMEEPKSAVDALVKYQRLTPSEERRKAKDLITRLRRSLATMD